MIYDFPHGSETLAQGDIFVSLPRIDFSLEKVAVVNDESIVEQDWKQIAAGGKPVEAVLPISIANAIVISQDCDASREADISFCEFRSIREVYKLCVDTAKVEKWASVLTTRARESPKWFYLPPISKVFEEKMAVDFFSVFRLPRAEVDRYRDFRVARLGQIAKQHFRERISEFFRRYPYDEWYPLNKEEFEAYRNSKGMEIAPFEWQQ